MQSENESAPRSSPLPSFPSLLLSSFPLTPFPPSPPCFCLRLRLTCSRRGTCPSPGTAGARRSAPAPGGRLAKGKRKRKHVYQASCITRGLRGATSVPQPTPSVAGGDRPAAQNKPKFRQQRLGKLRSRLRGRERTERGRKKIAQRNGRRPADKWEAPMGGPKKHG